MSPNTFGSITDVDAWEPVNGLQRCCPHCRSVEQMESVINQFQYDTNPRYTPRAIPPNPKTQTFCNIAVTDFLEHMGVLGPHWWIGRELSANTLVNWFNIIGPSYGWTTVSVQQAIDNANTGKPTIVGWKNPTGESGHVAILRHQLEAGPEPVIAQAGKTCFSRGLLSEGFGVYSSQVTYWAHP